MQNKWKHKYPKGNPVGIPFEQVHSLLLKKKIKKRCEMSWDTKLHYVITLCTRANGPRCAQRVY